MAVFVFVFFFCTVCGSVLCARLGAVCAARTLCALGAMCAWLCVRLAICVCDFFFVCALLDAVCATRCCACGRALLSIFLSHSEARMCLFALQIAAYCSLVAVSAQVMNAADAAALNQTLTGLGCWESSRCMTLDFNCSNTVVVRCNANGSVTSL